MGQCHYRPGAGPLEGDLQRADLDVNTL